MCSGFYPRHVVHSELSVVEIGISSQLALRVDVSTYRQSSLRVRQGCGGTPQAQLAVRCWLNVLFLAFSLDAESVVDRQ